MIGYISKRKEPMQASGNLPWHSIYKRKNRAFHVRTCVPFEDASVAILKAYRVKKGYRSVPARRHCGAVKQRPESLATIKADNHGFREVNCRSHRR